MLVSSLLLTPREILSSMVTFCVNRSGHLQRLYSKLERRKEKEIATVAAGRKLLEWIYHMPRKGKNYENMEKIAGA